MLINCRGNGFNTQQIGGLSQIFVEALCSAFLQSNQFSKHTLHELFHVRDFVYLVRYLHKKWFSGGQFSPSPAVLLRGLQLNLNGILPEDFEKLVAVFFAETNKQLAAHHLPEWDVPMNIETDTFVELIEDWYTV